MNRLVVVNPATEEVLAESPNPPPRRSKQL
jgi:hypothetical protein